MSALYKVILVIHILATVVGFGGFIAHSMYNARALRATAAEAKVLFGVTLDVSKIATYAIVAIMPLGIVLISLSDGVFEFSAPWISASFVVWFAMLGVAGALITKNLKAAAARVAEMDPNATVADDTEAVSALKKVGAGDAILQLLLVIAVVLMIWQPGN
ncbi:MAG: DUF2269 family protein [Acidimicrobiales bacterium]|nr:DUF2269 family protein [Acidimicrobiales bacterium]